MSNEIVPASKELQDADKALRRAAQTAKKLAEQNGTPYVVVESKTVNQSLQQAEASNKQ
jgi:diaminopimelate decarboxylase